MIRLNLTTLGIVLLAVIGNFAEFINLFRPISTRNRIEAIELIKLNWDDA